MAAAPSSAPLPRQQVSKRVGAYDLFNCIGQGSFASVHRGQHRESGRIVAVKQIVRARLKGKLKENLEAEISILQSIQHPCVMRLHEVQTTERNVYLILEFCPGGDLSQVIKVRGGQSEHQARVYLLQLADGLRHLREHNLVHRDLKPQNLLLTADGRLKIGDFGFARYMQQQDMAETLCGTPLYMAPEILRFHKCEAAPLISPLSPLLYHRPCSLHHPEQPCLSSLLLSVLSDPRSLSSPSLEPSLTAPTLRSPPCGA